MRNRRGDYIFISEGEVITAASVPDLDEWGWDSFWSCADWITWHKALRQTYGKETANLMFADHWNKQSFGAHALGCRTVDSDFRKYIESVGLYDIVWQSAEGLGVILKPIGAVMQTGEAVGTGALKGAETAAKGIKIFIPLLIAAGIIGLGIYGYRVATKKRV